MKEKYPETGRVRSLGLMIGIEMVDPETGEPSSDVLFECLDRALEKGVLFYFGGKQTEIMRMIPPLTITKEEIDQGLDLFEETLIERRNSK